MAGCRGFRRKARSLGRPPRNRITSTHSASPSKGRFISRRAASANTPWPLRSACRSRFWMRQARSWASSTTKRRSTMKIFCGVLVFPASACQHPTRYGTTQYPRPLSCPPKLADRVQQANPPLRHAASGVFAMGMAKSRTAPKKTCRSPQGSRVVLPTLTAVGRGQIPHSARPPSVLVPPLA